MTKVEYKADWAQHNATESHPYYGMQDDNDSMPHFMIATLSSLDDEQRGEVLDLLGDMLKRVLTVIVDAKSRTNAKASAIAARAALLHRALTNSTLNTRDIARHYGIPNNAVYDELPHLEKELNGLAAILH